MCCVCVHQICDYTHVDTPVITRTFHRRHGLFTKAQVAYFLNSVETVQIILKATVHLKMKIRYFFTLVMFQIHICFFPNTHRKYIRQAFFFHSMADTWKSPKDRSQKRNKSTMNVVYILSNSFSLALSEKQTEILKKFVWKNFLNQICCRLDINKNVIGFSVCLSQIS